MCLKYFVAGGCVVEVQLGEERANVKRDSLRSRDHAPLERRGNMGRGLGRKRRRVVVVVGSATALE